jgi:hypothetical protein
LRIPASGAKLNGWEFLRGSDDPLPLEVEEVRQRLAPP